MRKTKQTRLRHLRRDFAADRGGDFGNRSCASRLKVKRRSAQYYDRARRAGRLNRDGSVSA